MTRRDFSRKVVTGLAAAAVTSGTAGAESEGETAPATRVSEYASVRGFNYQPSWGSNDTSIWNHFREDLFARELDLGRQHFPKIGVLRIWFSPNPWLEDRDGFLNAAGRAMQLMAERNLKMLPVYFNGWHDYPDFGGFSILHLRKSKRNRDWALFRTYTQELQQVLSGNGRILMHDVSNEPFNAVFRNEGEAGLVREFLGVVANELHSVSPGVPVCVGTQGMSLRDLDWVDPFVDVHTIHPYVFRPGRPEQTSKNLERFSELVNRLRELDKPALVTECCWGTNDDGERARLVRDELSLYKRHGIGFLPHALHHSGVADLHRPRPGQTWDTMYMGFIDPDGGIRPGHEIFNEL
jgi:hypothetical protein